MSGLALVAAALAFDPGFTPGYEPLELGPGAPTSDDCGSCHALEQAEWSESRHHASWTNPGMQVAYIYEQQRFCVTCHAPLPRQIAEIRANRDWYRSQDPRDGVLDAPAKQPEPHAAEGIGCPTCHWRDGAVRTTRRTGPGAAPHALTYTPELATGDFCATCHDFDVPLHIEGVLTPTGVPMQATSAEWAAWRNEGGRATCQDCHMPRGSHRFRGAHDVALLRRSVRVRSEVRASGLVLTLRTHRVGHALPSGDIFRQLVVEVSGGDGWREVARFGRELTFDLDPWTGDRTPRVVRDNALHPGEPRTVHVPGAAGDAWRVRYLYVSEPALAARLGDEHVAVVLAHSGPAE